MRFSRVELIATAAAVISAIGSLFSAYMANRQVDAALEVVGRTEKTKALSDFVDAGAELCGLLLPPRIIEETTLRPQRMPTGELIPNSIRLAPLSSTKFSKEDVNNVVESLKNDYIQKYIIFRARTRRLVLHADIKQDTYDSDLIEVISAEVLKGISLHDREQRIMLAGDNESTMRVWSFIDKYDGCNYAIERRASLFAKLINRN